MAELSSKGGNQGLAREAVLANIPAFPAVVLRALDLLANDETNIAELVREIASDPTLSAQVLRLANSTVFGFACKIDTVQHATSLLGLSRVQSLIMTVATTNYMRATFRTEALARCWRHTIASAVICRELARAAGIDPERGYSFGLLHDIGRLALLVKYPDTYKEILTDADRDAVSLLDLEQKRFGMDHCEAGRILVERWNLPADFAVAAGRHHDPPEGGPLDRLKVVSFACTLADSLGYAVVVPLHVRSFTEVRERLPPMARERFPEDPEAVRALVEAALGDQGCGTEAGGRDAAPRDVPVGTFQRPAPGTAAEREAWMSGSLAEEHTAWDYGLVCSAWRWWCF